MIPIDDATEKISLPIWYSQVIFGFRSMPAFLNPKWVHAWDKRQRQYADAEFKGKRDDNLYF